jgi:hypothetical protein
MALTARNATVRSLRPAQARPARAARVIAAVRPPAGLPPAGAGSAAGAAQRGRASLTTHAPVPQARKNEVSDSYAKALVDLAAEKSQLEPIHADIDAVAALLKENAKLKELLFNPIIENDKKKAVVEKIAKEAGFNTYTTNFMNLLIRKDRLSLLDEICESFEEQYCKLTDTQVSIGDSLGRRMRALPGTRRAGIRARKPRPCEWCNCAPPHRASRSGRRVGRARRKCVRGRCRGAPAMAEAEAARRHG